VLKITPRIHGTDDVSLDVEAEFTVLAGQAVNGIPIVSSRKITSKVRLKDNESAVLAGMMSTSEAVLISGLAGLASIPGLGALVSQRTKTTTGDTVILVMKPHLVSESPDSIVTRSVWVGTDTRMRDLF
jgi:type II secretory pathway component GspD/PulD (secretin)